MRPCQSSRSVSAIRDSRPAPGSARRRLLDPAEARCAQEARRPLSRTSSNSASTTFSSGLRLPRHRRAAALPAAPARAGTAAAAGRRPHRRLVRRIGALRDRSRRPAPSASVFFSIASLSSRLERRRADRSAPIPPWRAHRRVTLSPRSLSAFSTACISRIGALRVSTSSRNLLVLGRMRLGVLAPCA